MTQPIHIMLDLETWGTEPGCDIRSIGACVFDPVAGYVAGLDHVANVDSGAMGTFYIACDNPQIPQQPWHLGVNMQRIEPKPRPKHPLKRDPQTVQWWSKQSAEAQAAFADPLDLKDALMAFGRWLQTVSCQKRIDGPLTSIRLWSHGPAFDPPILAAAYRAVGLPVPWHYRAPRDTRTCFDMAGIDDHSAWLEQHPGPMGIEHHALDDAICQAQAVCAAYERIEDSRDRDQDLPRVRT